MTGVPGVSGGRPITDEPGTPPTAPAGLRRALVAPDVSGTTPDGTPATLRLTDVGGPVLLAFLATRCDGCAEFWRGLAGAGEVTVDGRPVPVVIVTKGPQAADPGEVRDLGGGAVTRPSSEVPLLVMSDSAWADYGVLGYPFFVLVDADGRKVLGETVGFGWDDVVDMISTALSMG